MTLWSWLSVREEETEITYDMQHHHESALKPQPANLQEPLEPALSLFSRT